MEINKIVCIKNNGTEQWCRYLFDWNNIPVFVTIDGSDSRSALYKDGTSFFIISGSLLKNTNEGFVHNRLWHEVAHLFFRDVWMPWNIHYELRADLIAAAATGRAQTISRLYALKKSVSDPHILAYLNKRLDNLYSMPNSYTKDAAYQMLESLKPVTILK